MPRSPMPMTGPSSRRHTDCALGCSVSPLSFWSGPIMTPLANFPTCRVCLRLSSAKAMQSVEAVAQQWSWSIKPAAFRVGETVEFHVTSTDVNHGFALYNPDMRIVAQTQAMPGYINVLRYTFNEPGVYRVLCLEYCGVAHHEMTAEIKVSAH